MILLISIFFGTILAMLFPNFFLWMAPAKQPGFALTMLFVGTLVQPEQVKTFFRSPSRPLIGLGIQYTVMPLMAWIISQLFNDPMLQLGIILVGCMPGAMASNVMTLLFKGDLILSVTMTTIATLSCPLILAFWLPLLANIHLNVPVRSLAWNATWMAVLPVTAGIGIRYFSSKMPSWWDRVATILASTTIVLIILIVVAVNREQLSNIGPFLALAMLGLNLGGYSLAYGAGRILRWPNKQRRTLVIEVGMQNAGLGSVLALTHLGNAVAVPSAFYTVLCMITASLALPLYRKSNPDDQTGPLHANRLE